MIFEPAGILLTVSGSRIAGFSPGANPQSIIPPLTWPPPSLDEALSRLAETSPQHSRIVELRFFGGLSIPETAEALGLSHATVERNWNFARAWLRNELK